MPNDTTFSEQNEIVLKSEEVRLPAGTLTKQAAAYLALVEAFEIDSAETLQDAADERNKINDRFKELEAQRKHLKEPALEQGRRIDAFFKPVLETLGTAREIIAGKIAGYTEAERKKQEEAERKARETAEREAAEKRAQAAREEAEAAAKAAALRKQADELRAAGKEGQAAKLDSKAESVVVAGQQKSMNLQVAAEVIATAPVAVQEAPKAAGIGMEYTYSAEVTDMLAFARFVVGERPEMVVLLAVNESALNQQARSLKDALNFPGVRLVKKPKLTDRRR